MTREEIWIWGRRPVLEAVRAGRAVDVLVAAQRPDAPVLRELQQAASSAGVPLRTCTPHDLERIAPGENSQGVAALVRLTTLDTVADLLNQAHAPAAPPFLLVLDQVQDPHNVGAMLRTASAVGVTGVVLPDRRSAPLSGVVAKTSAGALSALPIARVTNLARALDEIRAAGVWIAGLDGEAPQSVFTADLAGPIALVVGSEGTGMRRLTRERCDFLLSLPMQGPIASLNVSVAASVAMYEVRRQRLAAPTGPAPT